MDLDTYIQEIETIASRVADDYEIGPPIEPYSLDQKMLDSFFQMIEVKKQLITENEKKQTNMIRCRVIDSLDVKSEIKILLTAIYIEVWEKVAEIQFRRSIEKYRKDHPIFRKNILYEYVRHDNELIDYNILKWDKIGCYCEYNGCYFRPSSFLEEEVLHFVNNQDPFDKKYIKLDAYYCSQQRPPMYAKFEVLRPVNPKWINSLHLFKNKLDGGHYILQEPEIIPGTKISAEQRLKFWEYKIRGIRSLEVHAQRNNSGNLSMMLEEIIDNPVCNKYYVAKCIHLDSDNNAGTQFENAVLNHIDLAINIYSAEAFAERKKQSLANGQIVDATLRTHLLRFDGVPFKTLINLSSLFFTSQILTAEWIADQFK